MNVLSLFGGIETGLIALKELGVKIDNYYSSEVDKYASSIARFNHPEIIELGDISNYKDWDLPKIDLILAGPPCQGLSVAGKGLNWDDPRSQLFFTAIEILWRYEPKYFLFENVASMKKEIRSEIDELMEVDHMMINSALVSAQNRKRNYWFNWNIEQPKNKDILLKDIIEGGAVDTCHVLSDAALKRINRKKYSRPKIEPNKTGTLNTNNNSGRLCFDSGTTLISMVDREKSLTITSTYRFNPQLYEYKEQKRKQIVFIVDKENLSFRKLTVIECERLQTLPQNYTEFGTNGKGKIVKISNTQRYKSLGNTWTKDVIKHILKGIL